MTPELITDWTEALNEQVAENTSPEPWATRCPRVGMVLVLHRVQDGFEYVLFDPVLRLQFLQDS